jgi:hypothetical protein
MGLEERRKEKRAIQLFLHHPKLPQWGLKGESAKVLEI